MPFEGLLESNLTATGYFKTLLSAAVGFYLWHLFNNFLCYSLLAFRTAGHLWSLVGNTKRLLFSGGKGNVFHRITTKFNRNYFSPPPERKVKSFEIMWIYK
jgi:hypothetical protein